MLDIVGKGSHTEVCIDTHIVIHPS
jgi:hypothetical protein